MNRELVAVGPETPAQTVRDLLRAYAVSSIAVVDDGRRPLGMVSACSVLDSAGTAGERMSRPAKCVDTAQGIERVARMLAAENTHVLVVVDGAGSAVGIVSALDVMRAMVGVPAHHPEAFPRREAPTGPSWTDDWPLDVAQVDRAPEGPGVLVLVEETVGEAEAVVWVEASRNVRERVARLARRVADHDDPALARVLDRAGLCFRAAAVRDDTDRERLAFRLRSDLEHRPPPGAT